MDSIDRPFQSKPWFSLPRKVKGRSLKKHENHRKQNYVHREIALIMPDPHR